MTHRFDPKQMAKLDSPVRRQILPPELVISKLPLQSGQVIADIGCGSGYFTEPLARQVGLNGKILAVDVAPEMLAATSERCEQAGLLNVEYVQTDGVNLRLPQPVEGVFLANVLHEVEKPVEFLQQLAAEVTSAGWLAVVEWLPQSMEWGPPLSERLTIQAIYELVEGSGWELLRWEKLPPAHGLAIARRRP